MKSLKRKYNKSYSKYRIFNLSFITTLKSVLNNN